MCFFFLIRYRYAVCRKLAILGTLRTYQVVLYNILFCKAQARTFSLTMVNPMDLYILSCRIQ